MTQEEQIQLRFVCKGCSNISCHFHIDEYEFIGYPHNCLYGSGRGDWRPQTLVDGVWIFCSEEHIRSLFYVEDEQDGEQVQ